MPLSRAITLLACLGLLACGRAPEAKRSGRSKVKPAQHSRSAEARLLAVRMSHRQARPLLGGHRYQGVHRVRVTLDGQPDRAFEDRYVLRCSAKGDCYGRQDNSLEYGVEFYRLGEHTYFRHRYQRFQRFTEEPEEAGKRVERIWGAGAAVVELLQPHLRLAPAGEASAAGRAASRYKLSVKKGGVAVHSGRRAWRTRLKPMRIEGEALLDKKSGVPLALKVSYAVSAPKGGRTVTIAGTYDGRVVEAGKPQRLRPPADFLVARPRVRETRDLGLLGSHRLHPGWFRGGGPYKGRRRPSRAMAPPRRPPPRVRPPPRPMPGPPGMGKP